MHRVVVRILARELVFKEGLQQIRGPSGISIEKEWEGRENDVDRLAIAVRRYLLKEDEWIL